MTSKTRRSIYTATVLLALASSTVFVTGVSAQQARMQPETAALRARGMRADASLRRPAASAYDVVVLRVEFQPDTTRFTTGDGTFGGTLFSEGLAPSIDPLPHDAGYFEAHMAFLRDYLARVSDGKTTLTTHVLPGIVRVSGKMGAYSPTGPDAQSDAELSKLASLVTEAWSLADPAWAAGLPALNPETTAFMLVHAGVGRDVELVGTILDKTPEDLPSLFLESRTLDRLDPRPRPVFAGIPVRHGLIVPRTETRQGFNSLADEYILAEFSVNGLLAASFFNFLGVPDLFDTATGESAIGPFGLMDGLGIFAFSGLFPPEPTAWTKYYLGWTEPIELVPGPLTQLEAVGSASAQVARASISNAEYFLVENRHRDPEGDGLVMQVWNQGQVSEVRFENGAAGFNASTVADFPGGVVLSVDQYDFALPGGKDEDGVDLVGGALIWHVDERVIAAGLPTNSVNADPGRRGLDLEEADSAQDIGNPIGGFFGPSFDLGSPFDFFYEGNPVVTITSRGGEISLYQNRFGPDTHPASSANDGGAGFLEIYGFSSPGAVMTVGVRRLPENGIEPLGSYQLDVPPATFGGQGLLRFVGSNGVMAFSGRAGELHLLADGVLLGRAEGLLNAEPAVAGNGIWSAGPGGFFNTNGFGTTASVSAFPAGVVARATTPVMAIPGPRGVIPLMGAEGSRGSVIVTGSGAMAEVRELSSTVLGLVRLPGNDVLVVLSDEARVLDGERSWRYPEVAAISDPDRAGIRPQFGSDRNGLFGVVPDPAGGQVHMLLPEQSTVTVPLAAFGRAQGILSGTPSLADLDHDGLLDVLIADQANLWGFTRTGAVAEGFPISTRSPVAGAPLAVETAQDADAIIILAAASDGQLDAYRTDSRRGVEGFPLSIGTSAGLGPALTGLGSAQPATEIMGISGDGSIAHWRVDGLGGLRGGDALGDAANVSFVATEPLTTTRLDVPGVLVPGQTYNWPNPVTEGITRFRLLPTVACSVTVLILDAAGNRVDELYLEMAPAEVPSEITWRTDAASGLYFARVRVQAVDGRAEDHLVKVAVIR